MTAGPSAVPDLPWWGERDALVLLTDYLAEQGDYSARDVAYAVLKPWKYEREYQAAAAVRDHEASHLGHECVPSDDLLAVDAWCCLGPSRAHDAPAVPCDWTHNPVHPDAEAVQ